ncbi:hypothetical protein FIBSPDRAFT_954346 [Athelia psychrophila]|uniref:Uncharacterized protein n=1 Tax=Athelia psychrophila TaxID=1759441 RepID=A0A166JA30_9AGAM|nr:hypothetical protein FIBSPDRAFT_954346 [Fibularhizoctonia sp. CBS 109695]
MYNADGPALCVIAGRANGVGEDDAMQQCAHNDFLQAHPDLEPQPPTHTHAPSSQINAIPSYPCPAEAKLAPAPVLIVHGQHECAADCSGVVFHFGAHSAFGTTSVTCTSPTRHSPPRTVQAAAVPQPRQHDAPLLRKLGGDGDVQGPAHGQTVELRDILGAGEQSKLRGHAACLASVDIAFEVRFLFRVVRY